MDFGEQNGCLQHGKVTESRGDEQCQELRNNAATGKAWCKRCYDYGVSEASVFLWTTIRQTNGPTDTDA